MGGRDSGWRANVALGEVVVDSRRSQEEVIGTATAPQECTCSQLAAGRTIVIIKEIYTIIWHVGALLHVYLGAAYIWEGLYLVTDFLVYQKIDYIYKYLIIYARLVSL